MLPIGTQLGRLRYRDVYLEYDGPQLFSAQNDRGKLYLAVHAPKDARGDNWLWAEISRKRLTLLEANSIELVEPFCNPPSGRVIVVTYAGENTFVEEVAPESLPSKWFPRAGVVLRDDDDGLDPPPRGELDNASAYAIGKHLIDINANEVKPYSLSAHGQITPMWRHSDEGRAILAALKVPVVEAANRSGRIVCDIVLSPETHREDVPLIHLGSFFIATQNLVDEFGRSDDPPKTRAGRRALTDRTQLSAVATFPSSFGIRIEATTGSTIPDERIAVTFDRILRLLNSRGDRTTIQQILQPLSPRARLRFRTFTRALYELGTGFSAQMGVPGLDAETTAAGSQQDVARMAAVLEAETQTAIKEYDFVGRLLGASLRTRFFLLEGAEQTISGWISDEAMPQMQARELGVTHNARVRTTTDVNEATGEEIQHHLLISIQPIVESRSRQDDSGSKKI